jgi:hypothetical protein
LAADLLDYAAIAVSRDDDDAEVIAARLLAARVASRWDEAADLAGLDVWADADVDDTTAVRRGHALFVAGQDAAASAALEGIDTEAAALLREAIEQRGRTQVLQTAAMAALPEALSQVQWAEVEATLTSPDGPVKVYATEFGDALQVHVVRDGETIVAFQRSADTSGRLYLAETGTTTFASGMPGPRVIVEPGGPLSPGKVNIGFNASSKQVVVRGFLESLRRLGDSPRELNELLRTAVGLKSSLLLPGGAAEDGTLVVRLAQIDPLGEAGMTRLRLTGGKLSRVELDKATAILRYGDDADPTIQPPAWPEGPTQTAGEFGIGDMRGLMDLGAELVEQLTVE